MEFENQYPLFSDLPNLDINLNLVKVLPSICCLYMCVCVFVCVFVCLCALYDVTYEAVEEEPCR